MSTPKSVILEREAGVVTDPRGVWLTGDAVRIMYGLGLGPDMSSVGHGTYQPPLWSIPRLSRC
jgi:hypothetical protein